MSTKMVCPNGATRSILGDAAMLWLLWTLSSSFSRLAGWALFYMLPYDVILFPLTVGLLLGVSQWALLRSRIPRIAPWIVASVVGWHLGATALDTAMHLGAPLPLSPNGHFEASEILYAALRWGTPALLAGTFQCLILRRRGAGAWGYWPIGNGLAYALAGGLVALLGSFAIFPAPFAGAFLGVIGGALAGAMSGGVLILLLEKIARKNHRKVNDFLAVQPEVGYAVTSDGLAAVEPASAGRTIKTGPFATPARATAVGALLGIPGLFVLAALCALTVGIPVPMRGWDRGPDVAAISPMVVIIYSLFFGGIPLIVAVFAGGLFGNFAWRYANPDAQEGEKAPDIPPLIELQEEAFEKSLKPLLAVVLVITATTIIVLVVGLLWPYNVRVVNFPEDRSMGKLLVMREPGGWRFLAEAQGDVAIPGNNALRLDVSAGEVHDLSPLAKLDPDALRDLTLTEGEVRDDDLEYVIHFRSLRVLGLAGPGFTNAGVQRIILLKELKNLLILKSGMTDAGLAQLAQLTFLQRLRLDGNLNLTDAGLRVLGDMGALTRLSLDDNPQFTDALAIPVARLTSLEHLFLAKTQLTDEGLKHLSGLTRLKRLSLEETKVTDAGLAALHGMRDLETLLLYGTGVTEEGANRLRQILPGCEVVLQGENEVESSPAVSGLTGTLKAGDPAPALKIGHWVKGNPVEIGNGRNESVFVVEFWATWCPPCRTSIPHLTEIQKKYRDDGVVVVGISTEDVAEVEPFVRKQNENMEYTVAVDVQGETTRAYMEAAGQKGIPCAFIVDRSGAIAWIGHPMDGEFEATLERLANEPMSASPAS